MTYEYTPKEPKIKEVGLLLALTLPALPLLALSQAVDSAFVWLYRFTAAVLLLVGFAFAARYLMRRYSYRVEPRDGVRLDAPPDLVVIEQIGKRARVVCRVSVSDVTDITPLAPEKGKKSAVAEKGKTVYRYTDRLSTSHTYRLTLREGDGTVYIRILADEKLFFILRNLIDSNNCLF